MSEQADIEKQIENFKDRVKFLRSWILELEKNDDFESKDKIYALRTEVDHKDFLIAMREHDKKTYEAQQKAAVEQLDKDFAPTIAALRKAVMPDVKSTQIANGISKRYSAGYKTIQEKIKDYQMAKQLISVLETPKLEAVKP